MFFFVQRAIKDIRNNRFLHIVTIITIALSTLIVSAFSLFFINASDILNSWKKGIRIIAYINQDLPNAQIQEINRRILKMDGVKGINFISKKDALERLKNQMDRQNSLLENLQKNPLPDAFEISMLTDTQSWENVERLATQIETLPMIDDVEYGQKWLGRFTSIFQLFKFTGIAMGIVFFMASVFIVANTIRLLFYSRHDEFEIMRLVGATDNFIRAPFYIEGLIQGALGGMLGIIILFLSFIFISSNIEQGFSSYYFAIRFLSVKFSFGIILCSMFAGWLGCYLSLKQFLKN